MGDMIENDNPWQTASIYPNDARRIKGVYMFENALKLQIISIFWGGGRRR